MTAGLLPIAGGLTAGTETYKSAVNIYNNNPRCYLHKMKTYTYW